MKVFKWSIEDHRSRWFGENIHLLSISIDYKILAQGGNRFETDLNFIQRINDYSVENKRDLI